MFTARFGLESAQPGYFNSDLRRSWKARKEKPLPNKSGSGWMRKNLSTISLASSRSKVKRKNTCSVNGTPLSGPFCAGTVTMNDALPTAKTMGRKLTADRVRFRQIAASAKVGSVTRSQALILAGDLPRAGIISGIEAHLLEALIKTCPVEQFDRGGKPIIYKSNRQLSFEINRSEGRVSRLLSRLYDLGLIAMQDSANYKRYPVQSSGEIVDACGIDLRLFIARYDELHELVRKATAEQAARERALRKYRGTLRTLKASLAGVIDQRHAQAHRLAVRADAVLSLIGQASRAQADRLRRAISIFERMIARLMGVQSAAKTGEEDAKMTCLHVENDMHLHNTNPHQYVSRNDERRSACAEQPDLPSAGYASKGAFEKSLTQRPAPINPPARESRLNLHDLVKAVPALAEYGIPEPKSWTELARQIPLLCKISGISEDARRRAVDQMGSDLACAAIAITFQKLAAGGVSSPGGYLRAMTDRAANGSLYLGRSLFGLLAKQGANVVH